MKTITLQEALRQPRVLIVPVYEDDAVPASICDALGYDFAHEETGKEGKIQRLSTLGRIAVPTLIFAGLGRRAEITYGKAKRCLGSALYACEEECCVWMDSMVCGRLDLHEAARALGMRAVRMARPFYLEWMPPQDGSWDGECVSSFAELNAIL